MPDEGKTGGRQIERLVKGDKTRTAKHSAVMNEIIDAVNKVLGLTVSPQESGKFIWSAANGVLQIEATDGSCGDEEPPETGTFVCGSVEGVKQWIGVENCQCATFDGGSA